VFLRGWSVCKPAGENGGISHRQGLYLGLLPPWLEMYEASYLGKVTETILNFQTSIPE
jgi:hypothetical protein